MATVLDELDRFEPAGEAGEQAAGVDLGELAGVADEHDLGAGPVGGVEERGEGAGAGHAGLVDDQHGAVVESWLAVVEVDAQPSQGRRGDRRREPGVPRAAIPARAAPMTLKPAWLPDVAAASRV